MLLIPRLRIAVLSLFSLFGALAATGVGRAQPPPAVVGGLPEDFLPGLKTILATAATRAPEAIRNSLEVEKAEGRKTIGASVLLPSVNASVRYAVTNESVSGNAGTANKSAGFFYDFSVRQPIYQWGALKAQADHEKIGQQIAERQYAQAYQQLLVLLRREYLSVVVRKAALQALREQMKFDEAAVEDQKQRRKDGLATPGEVALAELQVKQRQLSIDITAATLEASRRSVMRIAGLENLPDDSIPAGIPRPQLESGAADQILKAFAQGGVLNTPAAQMYAMSIKQTEQDYIIAKHRLYPKFSAFAGVNQRNETQATENHIDQVAVTSVNYGVIADWAVFDGFATSGQKVLAMASKRANERLLKTHVETTVDAARQQHDQLNFSIRGLDLAEASVVAAQAVLKDMEAEKAAGRKAKADVDSARLALARAEADILPARAEYLMKWTEFVSLVGADPAMNNLPARYVR